jgi:branched-chain amino acid transport system substrate-binding protein
LLQSKRMPLPLAGPGAWNTFDKKIAGAINVNFEMGSAISSDKMPKAVAFVESYEKRWGSKLEAGHGPAPSYESVYILAEAIERANSVDADAIVAELEKTNREGVMGRVQFDAGHQAVYDMDPSKAAVAAVFQWGEDGNRTIVFPPSVAEGKIMLPKGLKAVQN